MKLVEKLGNLALVVASNKNLAITISDSQVFLYAGEVVGRECYKSNIFDDQGIDNLIKIATGRNQ